MKQFGMKAIVLALVLAAGWAQAQTTRTFTGANSTGSDNWNTAGNWNPSGIPSGTDIVIIPSSKQVTCNSATTPTFSGNLTIGAGAYLGAGYGVSSINSYNCLGTAGSTIISMGAGSRIFFRDNFSPIMPEITLGGDVEINLGASVASCTDPVFSYPVTGAYTLTLSGKSDGIATFNAASANTFAKLVVSAQYGDSISINANAAGALGTGDVTIKANSSGVISANLVLGAANAIASTATLTLYGPASATKLRVTANNTVKRLVVDGVEQLAGTYGKVGSGAQFEVSWFNATSTATLTVTGAPSQYWDVNNTTAGAGGTTPSGTWDPSSTSNWNSDSTGGGGGSVDTWTVGQQAVFAAGTDGNGVYAVTISGTPDIGGLSFEEGTVTLSGGGMRMTSDSLVTVASGLTAEIATPVSNDSARQLSKVGAGTLLISGTSAYTGSTRLTGGILKIASLANAGSDSPIGNYPASGAGGLILGGGIFQYTGSTVSINRGLTLSGNATFDVNVAGTALTLGNCESVDMPGTLTVTGGAGSSLTVGRVRIVEGAQITLNPTTISMTVASVNGYTSYPMSSSITLGGTTTSNVVTGNIDVTNPPGSGFTQSLSVSKTGTSKWTLAGNSTYTGATTVNGGTLVFSGNPSGASPVTLNGGTLSLDYSTSTGSKLASTLAFAGGTLNLLAGTPVLGYDDVTSTAVNAGGGYVIRTAGGGVIRMNAVTRAAGGSLDFGAASIAQTDTLNINGILGGWATVAGMDWAINSTGAGDGPVTALATYDGGLPTSGGATNANYTLTGSQNQDGAVLANTVKLANSGNGDTLDLGANNLTITYASATSLGGILYVGGGDGNYNITGTGGKILTSTTTGELIVNVSTGTLTISAPFVATGATAGILTKTGAGKLVVSSVNTFTGNKYVNQGVLSLSVPTAYGTGGNVFVQNGAALELNGASTFARPITSLAGTGISDGGALRNVTGSGITTNSGAITLGIGGARINSDSGGTLVQSAAITTAAGTHLTVGGEGHVTISGAIGGAGNLTKDGAGTLTLSGANTFTGDTRVQSGIVALTSGGNRLPDGAALWVELDGKVNLATGVNETVKYLYLNQTPMAAGTWGGSASAAANTSAKYFAGEGVVTVLALGPSIGTPVPAVGTVILVK